MLDDDRLYHRVRAQQCREMAAHATDPEVKRRHEELAAMHAHECGLYVAEAPVPA